MMRVLPRDPAPGRQPGLQALVLLALLWIPLACASPPSATPERDGDIPRTQTLPGVAAAPFPYASPEEVGLSQANLHGIADQVYQWVAQGEVVGAEVLIVKDRRIVLHEALGWSDRDRGIPLRRNSIYRIRSMTKPFVGTAVLMLNEEGRVVLDAPVARYLASFDNDRSRTITIRQLLMHRTGFEEAGVPPGYLDQPTLRDAVDLLGAQGPSNRPGMGYLYSSLNTAILGALVATLTGAPLEEFLTARILAPLGLQDSHAHYEPGVAWAPRMNATYRKTEEGWVKYWDNTMSEDAPFFQPGGGMRSTTFDCARFLALWMDRGAYNGVRLLSASTVDDALWDVFGTRYGLHWQIFRPSIEEAGLPAFGHAGSDGTVALAMPDTDVLALYFTQSRGTSTPSLFVTMVLNLLG